MRDEREALPDMSGKEVILIRLNLDDATRNTDAMVQVSPDVYETAVSIPFSISKIAFQVVSFPDTELTDYKNITVPVEGRTIEAVIR